MVARRERERTSGAIPPRTRRRPIEGIADTRERRSLAACAVAVRALALEALVESEDRFASQCGDAAFRAEAIGWTDRGLAPGSLLRREFLKSLAADHTEPIHRILPKIPDDRRRRLGSQVREQATPSDPSLDWFDPGRWTIETNERTLADARVRLAYAVYYLEQHEAELEAADPGGELLRQIAATCEALQPCPMPPPSRERIAESLGLRTLQTLA
jgi:hypothetical protein